MPEVSRTAIRKETFTQRADLLRWVKNGEQLERKLIRFNLGSLLLGDDSENHALEANDEVVIYSAKDFMVNKTVSLDGFVKTPGVYDYVANMRLGDLLLQPGDCWRGHLPVSRSRGVDANPSIKKEIIQVDIDEHFLQSDEKSGLPLRNNDRVFVRKHPEFEKQAVVEILGEVRFPGRYVLENASERVSDLIRRAGGLKESGHPRAARLFRLDSAEPIQRLEDVLRRGEKQLLQQGQQGRPKEDDNSNVTGETGKDDAIVTRTRIIFDRESAVKKPGADQDLFLRDGDFLDVPKFENVVYVRGEVVNEITVAYDSGKGIDYYISLAGGFAPEADKENVTIIYPDGRELKRSGFLWFGRREVEPMSIVNVPEIPGRKHRF